MWTSLQVQVGQGQERGRFRVEGGQLVLEWRGGRHAEVCGLLKPEFVATQRLRKLAERAGDPQRAVA